MVPAGKSDAADIQLARHADWSGMSLPVQEIDFRIGDRAADRNGGRRLVGPTRPGGHIDRRLRRPVEVMEFGVQPLEEPPLQLDRQRLSAADHATHGLAAGHARRVEKSLEHWWN